MLADIHRKVVDTLKVLVVLVIVDIAPLCVVGGACHLVQPVLKIGIVAIGHKRAPALKAAVFAFGLKRDKRLFDVLDAQQVMRIPSVALVLVHGDAQRMDAATRQVSVKYATVAARVLAVGKAVEVAEQIGAGLRPSCKANCLARIVADRVKVGVSAQEPRKVGQHVPKQARLVGKVHIGKRAATLKIDRIKIKRTLGGRICPAHKGIAVGVELLELGDGVGLAGNAHIDIARAHKLAVTQNPHALDFHKRCGIDDLHDHIATRLRRIFRSTNNDPIGIRGVGSHDLHTAVFVGGAIHVGGTVNAILALDVILCTQMTVALGARKRIALIRNGHFKNTADHLVPLAVAFAETDSTGDAT